LSPGKDWSTVRELFEKRIPAYEDADLIVNTDNRSVEEVVSDILRELARL
jgi:shikimate kinase